MTNNHIPPSIKSTHSRRSPFLLVATVAHELGPRTNVPFIDGGMTRTDAVFSEVEITEKDQVVLVDASDMNAIPTVVSQKQVVEIIDHRKLNDSNLFPNATIQIALVGAPATLIAERFFKENIAPSKDAAGLLYLAIASNTVNFNTNNTTDRDRKMAAWLKDKSGLGEKDIHEMFVDKSQLTVSLLEILDENLATFDLQKRIGIVQLEILGSDKLLKEKENELTYALKKLQKQEKCELMFITCVDLERLENCFLVIDNTAKSLLESSINATFTGNVGHRPGILMRKEIVPLIKAAL